MPVILIPADQRVHPSCLETAHTSIFPPQLQSPHRVYTLAGNATFHHLQSNLHLELIRAEDFSENYTKNAFSDSCSDTLHGNPYKKAHRDVAHKRWKEK